MTLLTYLREIWITLPVSVKLLIKYQSSNPTRSNPFIFFMFSWDTFELFFLYLKSSVSLKPELEDDFERFSNTDVILIP